MHDMPNNKYDPYTSRPLYLPEMRNVLDSEKAYKYCAVPLSLVNNVVTVAIRTPRTSRGSPEANKDCCGRGMEGA